MKSFKIKELVSQIESQLLHSKYIIHAHGYKIFFKSNKQNKPLFNLLHKIGFFKFHVTNKGHIVSYHQIVAFIFNGWKKLKWGSKCIKGKTEIHHIDNNTSNNSPYNLAYTSPIINKAIATITSIVFNKKDPLYYGTVQWSFQDFDVNYGDKGFLSLLISSIKALGKLTNFDSLTSMFSIMPYPQSCLLKSLISSLSID